MVTFVGGTGNVDRTAGSQPIERASEEVGRLQLPPVGVNPLGRRDLRSRTYVSEPSSVLGAYVTALAQSRPPVR